MMRGALRPTWWLRGVLLALLTFAPVLLTSCASSDDQDSARDRPWNEPQGWENGMPPGFYEGRH